MGYASGDPTASETREYYYLRKELNAEILTLLLGAAM
jgi:hypothetical protein